MSTKEVESLRNPVPAVVYTPPAFTVVLKKAAGKSFLLLNGFAAAPSQLISLRPAGCSPAAPPFGAPSKSRKAFTFAVMSPVAVTTVAWGAVGVGVVTESSLHAASASAEARTMNLILVIESPLCVRHLWEEL